jgi:peptidoglycan L-alanyl-D-glutamate endopeptidase CwlK
LSRNLEDLDPKLIILYQEFNLKMGEAGLIHVITSTSRSILEQMALFVQGRLPLVTVNTFRFHAGLRPIENTDNNMVTWTLDSKHVTNMFDKDLNNDKSKAFDIAILNKQGQAVWDIKISVNDNDIPDYDEAGIIGESVGLKWGGRFSHPDRPHFELA